MFKKSDIVLIIFLTITAISSMFLIGARLKTSETVLITIDGKLYDKVSINENKIIDIVQENIHNTLKIENGSVQMIESNCKDHICVEQGSISFGNQTIVCLPNKIVVELESVTDSDIDILIK